MQRAWWYVIALVVIILVVMIVFKDDIGLSPRTKSSQKTIGQLAESSVAIESSTDCEIFRDTLTKKACEVIAGSWQGSPK